MIFLIGFFPCKQKTTGCRLLQRKKVLTTVELDDLTELPDVFNVEDKELDACCGPRGTIMFQNTRSTEITKNAGETKSKRKLLFDKR